MDHDQAQESGSKASHGSESAADGRISEPVRSRWTPKPEQILILESIFNSGMVNPPKDETVRIRKLLEKFGSVGDANVFYWFQNRRSRSRRRQRQIQASLGGGGGDGLQQTRGGGGSGSIQFESMAGGGYAAHNNSYSSYPMNAGSCFVGSGSSSSSSSGVGGGGSDGNGEGFYAFSGGHTGVQDFDHNAVFGASDSMHYPSGVITVFINGVATEVGRGPLDMKAMFGGEFVLFHSTGVPVQVNDYGFLVHSLQHGESYFLVPRNS